MANDHIADDRKKVRLIDANALKDGLSNLEASGGHKYYRQGMDDVLHKFMPSFIDEQPTVDAVEVVRCKDCEHYEAERVGIPGGDPRRVYECGYCYYWRYEEGDSPNSVDADDFCSYGERRTE